MKTEIKYAAEFQIPKNTPRLGTLTESSRFL